jgi:hypothetical protein
MNGRVRVNRLEVIRPFLFYLNFDRSIKNYLKLPKLRYQNQMLTRNEKSFIKLAIQ